MAKEMMCDSGFFISLTDSCLAEAVPFLAKKLNITMFMTDFIEYECIIHPLNLQTREYSFSALRIRDALNNGAIKKVSLDTNLLAKRDELLNAANNIFFAQGKPITLVQLGEMEIVTIANALDIKQILMDERTTRLLIEAPMKIKDHFEQEFNTHVMVNKANLDKFTSFVKGMQVFRSTEFISLAYQNGFFDNYKGLKKDVYAAALYKLKYAGCAISYAELEELIKMA